MKTKFAKLIHREMYNAYATWRETAKEMTQQMELMTRAGNAMLATGSCFHVPFMIACACHDRTPVVVSCLLRHAYQVPRW